MKNKKILKKMVATAALLGITVIPTIAWASTTYTSTLSFNTSLTGKMRYYSGNSITLQGTSKASRKTDIDVYAVNLVRKNTWSTTTLATKYFWRDKFDTNTWYNVGSGTYCFYFSKANDGVTITSNKLYMHSFNN